MKSTGTGKRTSNATRNYCEKSAGSLETDLCSLIDDLRDATEPDWSLLGNEIYLRLKSVARGVVGGTNQQTLTATVLLHEAFIKASSGSGFKDVRNIEHFFALFSLSMRQLLIDYVRQKRTWKRGGKINFIEFDSVIHQLESQVDNYEDLHEALEYLHKRFPRAAVILEMQVFSAMTIREISSATGKCRGTVQDSLRLAKAEIRRFLGSKP